MPRVSDLVNTNGSKNYNELPPLHKELVDDFFKLVDKQDGGIVDKVETAIDKASTFHNVHTDVLYNYIEKEVGF